MLTVVVWRWGKKFSPDHVARMRSMLSRHLHQPHRIVCITDKPKELTKGIESAPMPASILKWDIKTLRRMWLYSKDARSIGDRLFQLDLDVVITDTIDPLVNRPEPFVIWKSDSNWKDKWAYNATAMLVTPGAVHDVWERWWSDPKRIFAEAEADGWGPKTNTDQAIACYLLKDREVPVWTWEDGIRAFRVFAGKHGDKSSELPEGTRIVSFHGPRDPSIPDLQRKAPWIREHWN